MLTTTATTAVATTAYGGSSDAGTSLTVQPHITDGDRLRVDYTISISTFVGSSSDPALPPPRQENLLSSSVTIPDGYTAVLGGLEVETESEREDRVPLLGRIPVIGALFRDRSKEKARSRFFVFLRCSVLRSTSFEDLRWVSDQAMREASIENPWPVLEPRVIR